MWQSRQHLAQVGKRIKLPTPAVLDDGVDDRAALARVGISDEEPILFAQGCRPDRIFNLVVVQLHPTVAQVHLQRGPLA